MQEQSCTVPLVCLSCAIPGYVTLSPVQHAKCAKLSLNFFRPMFLRRLLEFQPDIVHYVDPIWLGTQAQPIIERYLPDTGFVSSYHTNLAM